MVRRAVHRSLDGYRVVLSGGLDLNRPWTSVLRCAVAGRPYELTAGGHAFAASWARDLGVAWDEEFTVRGGRLLVGRTARTDGRTGLTEPLLAAAWIGRRHALTAHLYHAGTADAVRLFGLLEVREYADGVAVGGLGEAGGIGGPGGAGDGPGRDRPGAVVPTGPAEVVKEVPGLGLLEITALDRRTRRRLPSWRGARVRAGELFRDTHEEEGVYFVLATRTALVTVLPLDADPARVPALVDRVAVEVLRPGAVPASGHGTGRTGEPGPGWATEPGTGRGTGVRPDPNPWRGRKAARDTARGAARDTGRGTGSGTAAGRRAAP